MKKYLIALTLFIAVVVTFADVWVYQSDGTRYSHNYSTFDSLSRVAPGTLALSQSERIVPCEGETFNLDIYANQSWTATVTNANRVRLNKTHGNGNDAISVTVTANKQDEQMYDTITVRLADGTQNAIHLIGEAWQDDLTVNPLSQKFTPAGGTFKVGIESNTSWAVDNIADWVLLDKTSGMLNDSITVNVSPSDTYKTTQSILTVTTPNKTILHSVVTRIGDEVSVIPSSKTFSPLGGSYKIYVSSNTGWTVSASEPWVTFDKLSGTLNDSIVVNVAKSDKVESTSAIITITTLNGKTTQSKVIREQDAMSVGPLSKTFAPAGGTYKIGVQSNTDWTVSASEPWVTFDKTNGTLNDSVIVMIGKGDKDAARATIVITTSGGKTETCVVVHEGDSVSVNPTSKTFAPAGGIYKIGVQSNTNWTVSANEPWVTLDKTNGTLNDSIVVNVAKSANVESTSAIITVTTSNGKTSQCDVIRDGDNISLNPTTKTIAFDGDSFDVVVASNTDWTVSSDKSWVTLSKNKGSMDDLMVVTISAGSGKIKADEAIITYTTSLGVASTLTVTRLGYTGIGDVVTDINGKSYPTVWIYGQNWMAENLKCDKYDTESEAYNASWLSNNKVPTSSSSVDTPYYTDGTYKIIWSSTEHSGNLSNEQIAKLGYLYNWAAAVGVENGNNQTTAFAGNRQGICPNGWHVPSYNEWQTLNDYICSTQKLSPNTVDKYLKTTSGWYSNGNGTDSYGFAALPSGRAYKSSVSDIGDAANFWTAAPDVSVILNAYYRYLFSYGDYLHDNGYGKDYGRSVRCLKD